MKLTKTQIAWDVMVILCILAGLGVLAYTAWLWVAFLWQIIVHGQTIRDLMMDAVVVLVWMEASRGMDTLINFMIRKDKERTARQKARALEELNRQRVAAVFAMMFPGHRDDVNRVL